MAKLGSEIISILDIGTTKIVCFIASVGNNGNVKIIGIGHQVAHGIKSGTVTDIKSAESSIRNAVGSAEQMAGIYVDKVVVNISGGKQKSNIFKIDLPISGRQIAYYDLVRLAEQASLEIRNDEREIVHSMITDYAIDGTWGIGNPKGMIANILSAAVHVIDVQASHVYNLANCLAKCHLDIENYVAASYASSIACLTQDEMNLGSILIDIGGGNTSAAIFKNNKLLFADVIPLGGINITNDVALGLNTSVSVAERIKNLYGNIYASQRDEHEMIDIAQFNEHGQTEINTIAKSSLINIIRPRVEEIFEIVQKRFSESGYNNIGGNIVLTGGTSQMLGIKHLVQIIFGRQVRIGMPRPLDGLAESTSGPAFSTAVGILLFAMEHNLDNVMDIRRKSGSVLKRPMHKMLHWFKEKF